MHNPGMQYDTNNSLNNVKFDISVSTREQSMVSVQPTEIYDSKGSKQLKTIFNCGTEYKPFTANPRISIFSKNSAKDCRQRIFVRINVPDVQKLKVPDGAGIALLYRSVRGYTERLT
jgi:hypothetical protein